MVQSWMLSKLVGLRLLEARGNIWDKPRVSFKGIWTRISWGRGSMARYGDKVDRNQLEIIKLLEKIPNLTVEDKHDDILVGYMGRTLWYEIKHPDTVSPVTGEVVPSSLTTSEKHRKENWLGHYKIVWDIVQIIDDLLQINKELKWVQ